MLIPQLHTRFLARLSAKPEIILKEDLGFAVKKLDARKRTFV
jgi:hypothetical protein